MKYSTVKRMVIQTIVVLSSLTLIYCTVWLTVDYIENGVKITIVNDSHDGCDRLEERFGNQ